MSLYARMSEWNRLGQVISRKDRIVLLSLGLFMLVQMRPG
jgi:hypothetical protein